MSDDSRFIPIALRLIKKHGRAITFIELAATPPNPSFPFEGPTDPRGTPARSLATFGCFVEPDSLQRLGMRSKIDDLIERSQRILIVPGPNDLSGYNELIDESENHKITGIETLRPGLFTLLSFVGTMR